MTAKRHTDSAGSRQHAGSEKRGRKRRSETRPRMPDELLEFVLARAGVVLWGVDANGTLTASRGRGLERLGQRPGETVGRPVADVYADAPELLAAFRRALKGDEFEQTMTVQSKRLEVRFVPLWSADGDVTGALAVASVDLGPPAPQEHLQELNRELESRMRDQTGRLRLTESQWRSLVESAPDFILTLTPDGTIEFINRTLPQHTREGTIGTSIYQYLAEPYHETTREMLRTVLETGEPVAYEVAGEGLYGAAAWYCGRIAPIRHDGRIESLIIVATDITTQKEAEATARRRQEELAHVSRLSMMGEMITALAHELNNPLCVIVNYAQAVTRTLQSGGIESETLLDALREISSEAHRASETIRRIRAFLGRREIRPIEIDAAQLVTEALALARPELDRHRVAVETLLADDLPPLMADVIQLEQVLVNLLLNACEAMSETPPDERTLTITTATAEPGRIRISVRDHGCGLGDQPSDKIFEAFKTTKQKGLGLGLSISRSIVEAHHGRLEARTHPEGGAVFTLLLPAWGKGRDEG
ncbi:MAG: PAS domain-containing sensor histidine kinase [Planctomycetaceae bacterium]